MENETVLVQARIRADVVKRIKDAGYGRFAAGLYILLDKLDEVRGAVAKHDEQIANKGVRKSDFKEDPRLKRTPGEHQAKYNARLTAYINNLPETKKNKIRAQLEHYITRFYELHRGIIDETTMFETQMFDAKGNHLVGAGEEIRIMDYITEAERDAWVLKGVAHYRAGKVQSSEPAKPSGHRAQLSADSRHVYQNFPTLLASLTDEQIETMNEECDGALERGDDPIDPPTAENTN